MVLSLSLTPHRSQPQSYSPLSSLSASLSLNLVSLRRARLQSLHHGFSLRQSPSVATPYLSLSPPPP
ncbi:hypothetical protein RchiOBHm_Chr5g0001881 [Rosa chinensis]|uniref:Uncharacterized protein n=1 Tax=Rosa chinensis TaxID=74649 RepID=A0A2P6Q2D0_ROSCH|nr:hypothetical protein RchiOBHm_Chr5g0001881 [Rosa chinensis]